MKIIKNSIIAIIVIILFIMINTSAFDFSSPSENHKAAVKYVGRQKLKEQLRDPDSLEIIEEKVTEKSYYAKFRAKNGFGGYTIEEFYAE